MRSTVKVSHAPNCQPTAPRYFHFRVTCPRDSLIQPGGPTGLSFSRSHQMHKRIPAGAILLTLIATALVVTVFSVIWAFVNQLR